MIPGFAKEFLLADDLYRTVYIIVYFALCLLEILWIFSLNYYLLVENSFIEALRNSIKLIDRDQIQ